MSDVNACISLTVDQYGGFLAKYGVSIDLNDLRATVEFIINNGTALVAERDGKLVGMCAWIIAPHPANNNCKCWQEVLWTMRSNVKTDALKLFRAMLDQAKGCQIQVLARLSTDNGEQIERLYKSKGFEFMESHFSRQIGDGICQQG